MAYTVDTLGAVNNAVNIDPLTTGPLPTTYGPGSLLHEKLAALPPNHYLHVAFANAPSNLTVGGALQELQDEIDRSRTIINEQTVVYHTDSLRLLLRSATSFNALPDSYYKQGVSLESTKVVGSGAFGDVYRGKWTDQDVALKVLRVLDSDSTLYPALLREIIIWKQLSHPNIQPFQGVDTNLFPSRLAVISNWEEKGTINKAIRTLVGDELDTHRLVWVIDIVQGLKYLHDNHIVHGDLRGENILITAENRARLTDFGLTSLADATTRTMGTRSGLAPLAWAAPELSEDVKRPNFACDVYSFACTCIEIYSGDRPFAGLTDLMMMKSLSRGGRPSQPVTGEKSRAMPEWLWQLVQWCWIEEPSARPTMEGVVQEIMGHITSLSSVL